MDVRHIHNAMLYPPLLSIWLRGLDPASLQRYESLKYMHIALARIVLSLPPAPRIYLEVG